MFGILLQIFYLMVKIMIFWVEVTDVSAQTATLTRNCRPVHTVLLITIQLRQSLSPDTAFDSHNEGIISILRLIIMQYYIYTPTEAPEVAETRYKYF